MFKSLLYGALLMGVSLRAMEERFERREVSDEMISAVLSRLFEDKSRLSDAEESDSNEGSPIKAAPKEVSSSVGELSRGSGGELPELSELDNLRERIFRLLTDARNDFLRLSGVRQTTMVEEALGALLESDEQEVASGLEENLSDKAARAQTGPGAGCLIWDREKDIHTPGDRVKPPESTTSDFPHMP